MMMSVTTRFDEETFLPGDEAEELTEEERECLEFWLNDANFTPSRFLKFFWVLRSKILALLDTLISIFSSRSATAKFVAAGACGAYVAIPAHETLHAIGAIGIGGRVKQIGLGPYYEPFSPMLEKLGVHVGSDETNAAIPHAGWIHFSTPPAAPDSVAIAAPNVVLLTLGMIWILKGVREKKPGWFGAGLGTFGVQWRTILPNGTDLECLVSALMQSANICHELATLAIVAGIAIAVMGLTRAYDLWIQKISVSAKGS